MMTFAARTLWRERRAGDLRLLLAALVVAVAAVTMVGFFNDRVARALANEASALLGGDLVLVSDHPVDAARRAEAAAAGLRTAHTRSFPSMVQGGGQVKLAEIKAVDADYPLLGRLRVQSADGTQTDAAAPPGTGEAWIDARLAGELGLAPGMTLTVGARTLRVGAILGTEPDRGINVFSVAPRLLMALDDLPGTGLDQPGARIADRLLLAGPPPAIGALRARWQGALARGERLEDTDSAPPEMRRVMTRAQRFLGLSGALTVVLAAVAVALAARRYLQRQMDASAVMRCLGLGQRAALRLHVTVFAYLAGLAALLGGAIGFAAHFLLVDALGGMLGLRLPAGSGWPLLHGALVAAVLLLGLGTPPLAGLARVPALRVLRRELAPPDASRWLVWGAGGLALAGLMALAAGEARLALAVTAGFALGFGVFWGISWSVLGGVLRLPWPGGAAGQQAKAALRRYRGTAALQVVAVALGLMALILLGVTRQELLDAWSASLPPEAPNRFVINIQPDQRDAVLAALQADVRGVELSPMVRGRLSAIAGRPVSAASYPEDERAQRLVEREFNLSWRDDLPPGNRVSEGAWFTAGAAARQETSVEAGLAKTLGIRLGDTLDFSLLGETRRFTVTSLRALSWDSMRVNFFVLMPPGLLDPAQASYITSFYLPPGRPGVLRGLVERFPNLSVIDTDAVLDRLRHTVGQVSQAVQFVFVSTVAAGLLVLFGSLIGTAEARRRDWAILRTLGARRALLRQGLIIELAVTGALAGLLAGIGATAVGWALARWVFEFALPLSPAVWLGTAALGAVLSVVAGSLALQRVLGTPPLAVLRAEG